MMSKSSNSALSHQQEYKSPTKVTFEGQKRIEVKGILINPGEAEKALFFG